jgi:precorrin-3B synthase
MTTPLRTRADLCPGVLRPWIAEDGPLVRIRLCGGFLTRDQLTGLVGLATEHGDGEVHLTKRANLQVRAVHDTDGFADGLEAIGLLPSRSHELVRNIVVAPYGERLRAVAARFDELLCADEALAELPARFLFSFDDDGCLGRLRPDLGVLGDRLVIGGRLGETVDLADVPHRLIELAHRFLALRGTGPQAPWHVRELTDELAPAPAAYPVSPAPPQLDVPDGVLTAKLVEQLQVRDHVVVTPWRGLVVA